MSYADFKRYQKEFDEVFSLKSEITKISDYPDSRLNMVLSSAHFMGSLKPILCRMLKVEDLDDLKVALIPNAANYSGKMEMVYGYLEQFTTLNNMYLKMLDVSRWPKQLILDGLDNADIIAVNGGFVSYFIKALDEADLRNEFLEIIRGGKPYMGFSAGSMIFSETTHFAKHYINEQDPEINNVTPLGLVDFEVYPHFEPIMEASVRTMLPPELKGYAITDTEAIIITEGELLKAGEPLEIN